MKNLFKFFFFAIFLAKTVLLADELDDKIDNKLSMYKFRPVPVSKEDMVKYIEKNYDLSLPITDDVMEIGKMLWFDPRLSADGTVSCNTCHDLNTYGVDGLQTSFGVGNVANPSIVNSPTVYNSVFNRSQFWNGRASNFVEQAAGPLLSKHEMANTKEGVVNTIKSIPGYVELFNKVAPDKEITFEMISEAIAIFESFLVTPTRFDDFLRGNKNALSQEEKEGFYAFLNFGCASCHYDVNLGGGMHQFEVFGKYDKRDIGAFQKDEFGKTKVPTLRNVTYTGPYFHNGAVGTLQEAIKTMGKVQLGIQIDDVNALKIIKFLKALDGRPGFVESPELPK